MIVIRIEPSHATVLDGRDGRAVGRAEGAVAAHFLNFIDGLCWFGHFVLRFRVAGGARRFKVQGFKVGFRTIELLNLEPLNGILI
jgi:hypothetical protein